MTRSEIKVIPEYYKKYAHLVPADMHLNSSLSTYGESYIKSELDQYTALGNRTYADKKWTIKEILIHLIDTERVFAYRALRFGRGDSTPLPGFEQDDYVSEADVSERTIENIFEEFCAVRRGSIALFNSFDDRIMIRSGIASGQSVSVLALGFMICGHLIHHQQILEEKYYPLIAQ